MVNRWQSKAQKSFTHEHRETEREVMEWSESEQTEQNTAVPRLPLLSLPPMESPERSGMHTPPIYTAVSVPFRWEEEPGKPRLSSGAALGGGAEFGPKILELPPRLLVMGRTGSQSSSFRDWYGSFRAEEVEVGAVLVRRRWAKERGCLGSWRRRVDMGLRGKREVEVGGLVFPDDTETEISALARSFSSKVEVSRFRRNGSFSSITQARPHFWATVCKGLKQVVPWRSKRKKREA